MIDERFGNWLVLEYVGKNKWKEKIWKCKCDCGNEVVVVGKSLTRKRKPSRSCGCSRRAKNPVKSNPLYGVWYSMKSRCYNVNNPDYESYGGRGIKVCERWLDSLENFCEDMGEKPTPEYSINRIDNDGDYCPDNCEWAAKREQVLNRRRPIKFSSKFIGVSASGDRFIAGVWHNNKQHYLGVFDDELEAARAYNNYVIENNLDNKLNKI